jgi:uncharacterized radical SAM superfamily protein
MDSQTSKPTEQVPNELAELDFLSNEEIIKKIKTLDFETNSFKSDIKRFTSEQSIQYSYSLNKGKYQGKVKENREKLKLYTQLPHLISSVAEVAIIKIT